VLNSPVVAELVQAMKGNSGKIPTSFINKQVSEAQIIHIHPTANTRICVIQLTSGHEVVGVAQVLDAKNDVEAIGKSIALQNATEQLWQVFGSIAKVL